MIEAGLMTIGLPHYLMVGAIIFAIAVFGIFFNRRNMIVILLAIELMLLAVQINMVAFSAHLGDMTGQIFTIFIFTIAAAESAIGLSVLVAYFRNRGNIDIDNVSELRG